MSRAKKAAAKRAAPKDASFRPFASLQKKAAAEKPAKAPARPAPPPPPTGEPSREPDTFSAYMAGVERIEGKARRLPATQSSLEAPAPDAAGLPDLDAPARARFQALVTDSIRFEVIDDGSVLEGRRLDVDPRELRRLRQGRYPLDGSLDLHGHPAEEARAAVTRFVARRRKQGDRAVRIVHGKGKHSARGHAVLRGELGAWLSQGSAAQHVLAFASLQEEDGSTGSIAVLLAKR